MDARRMLQEIISKETHTRPDGRISQEWFIQNRWLPAKTARWNPSTLGTNTGLITHQILKRLGAIPLEQIDKFQLQTHLNALADQGLSYSVVQHVHSLLKNIFDEAEEQEYILRNPSRRLEIPRVVRPMTQDPRSGIDSGKPFLSLEQLTTLLQCLPNVKRPDRLIVMLADLCALRPGEVFGLTWQCYTEDGLYIMQRVSVGSSTRRRARPAVRLFPYPQSSMMPSTSGKPSVMIHPLTHSSLRRGVGTPINV